jgi:prephenate dehydrogenase
MCYRLEFDGNLQKVNTMDIQIVGDGVFGTFLRNEFKRIGQVSLAGRIQKIDVVDTSNVVVLAVPAHAYKEVASQHAGKHLVNVCSVQSQTTADCLGFSDMVTSIHPMFGPRSPVEGRTCIVTRADNNTDIRQRNVEVTEVLDLFSAICDKMVTHVNDEIITPETHDRMMARTHLQVVKISDTILKMVDEASDIPDECLPTSFKRLKAMAEQFLDMPPGTKDSILANIHEQRREGQS